ncbi:MAG: hypothetical protein GDA40_07225 [Rhodobacteraceae bacterium]|nr:hypothetical protein [Paracoccaceae bacterium]
MSLQDDEREVGDWKYLWREIKRRTSQPISNAPFVIYVLGAIVGLGGLGVWVETIELALRTPGGSQTAVLTALCTFFPALFGSATFRLILDATGKGDKVLVSLGYFVLFLGFGAVIPITRLNGLYPVTTFWVAVLCSAIAVWLWWIANGDDPTYKTASVDAPSGGDPEKRLKGTTQGFKE